MLNDPVKKGPGQAAPVDGFELNLPESWQNQQAADASGGQHPVQLGRRKSAGSQQKTGKREPEFDGPALHARHQQGAKYRGPLRTI